MIRFSFRKVATCAVIALGALASAQPALAAKMPTVNGVIVAQTSPKAVVVSTPNGHLLRVVLFRAASGVIGRRLRVTGVIDGLGIMTAYSSALGARATSAPFSGTVIANDAGIDYLADGGVVLTLHAGVPHAPGRLLSGVIDVTASGLTERTAKVGVLGGALNISGIVSVIAGDGIAMRLAGGANVWVGFKPKVVVDVSTLWPGAAAILKAEIAGSVDKPVLQFTNDAVLTGPRAIKAARKLETQGTVKSLSGQRIAVAPLGSAAVQMVIGPGVSVDGVGTDDTVLVDAHQANGSIVADHIVLVARSVPAVKAQATWTSTPPTHTTARTATFDWSLIVKADLVACYLDLDTYTPCAAPFTTGTLTPGAHSFTVWARNAKGIATSHIAWRVDDPIQVQLVSSPTPTTTATSATFVYKVTGTTTHFKCALSDGTPNQLPLVPCTPVQVPGKTDQWSVTYGSLSLATHSFALQASNDTTDVVSDNFLWSVVPVAPVVTVTAPVSDTLTSSTVRFTATNAPTGFTCALDGAPATACSGGSWPVTGLSLGAHTVTVKASNSGGTGTSTGSWTVSAPPVPVVTLPGAPSGSVATTAATIYWYASGSPDSETCKVDAAPAASCPGLVASGALAAGSFALSALAPGSHTVVVSATNSSGTSSASATWTIAQAPVVAIIASPVTGTATTGAVYFSASNTPTLITCQLDTAAAVVCTSPYNLMGLSLGQHTLTVTASNVAGTDQKTTAAWTVNAAAAGVPVITVTSAPSGTIAPPTPTITWTVTNTPTSVTCQLDGGAIPCTTTSYVPSAGLAAGAHTLLVTAANGTGSGTATVAWTIAATPAVSFTASPSSGTATTGSVSFTASSSPTAITCAVDAGVAAPCASPYSLTGLTLGAHSVTVSASNVAGTGSATTPTWTVQGPSPVVSLTSPPTGSTTTTSATIAWTATNSPTGTSCKLDAAPVTCTTSPFATGLLGFGPHTFVVTATNATGSGSATASWTVTAVAPTVALTTGAAGFPPLTNATPNATFTWTAGGGAPTSITCQLDATAAAACTSPKAYTALGSGTHSFTVTVTNTGGTATATYTWAVAAGAVPTVSFTQAPPTSTTATTATLAWSTTNGPTTDTCTLDGATYTPCTAAAVNLSGLAVGTHTFIVVAANASGSGQATASWTVSASTTGTPPVNTALPTLSASATAQTTWKPRSGLAGTNGYILTNLLPTTTDWTGATTFSYQWYTCSSTTLATCTVISGATASMYHATAADIDRYLIGSVIASNASGSTTAYTVASAKTQPS